METQTLKQAIEVLKEELEELEATGIHRRKQAFSIAISHLETLQKVRESGGVKRKEYLNRDNVSMPTPLDWEIHRKLVDEFNQALDLKDAELTERSEGLKLLLINEFEKRGVYFRWEIDKVAILIQELFLGKKEE